MQNFIQTALIENKLLKEKNVVHMLKKNISKSKRCKEVTNTTKKGKAKRKEISVKKRLVNK